MLIEFLWGSFIRSASTHSRHNDTLAHIEAYTQFKQWQQQQQRRVDDNREKRFI